VVTRDGRGAERDGYIGVTPEHVLAIPERLLVPVADDPVPGWFDDRFSVFGRLPRKCIAESVDRSNEADVAAVLAQGVAQLADEAGERGFRHERRRPQPFVKLALRDSAGTCFNEDA
jgi:hypothetical protein